MKCFAYILFFLVAALILNDGDQIAYLLGM